MYFSYSQAQLTVRLGLTLLLFGCAAPGGFGAGSKLRRALGEAPPALTLASLTTPADNPGAGRRELHALSRQSAPAARLRTAFLLGESHRGEDGIRVLNAVLHGDKQHGPTVVSMARYLRSELLEARGESDRAAYDRSIALDLAQDPDLRQRLYNREAARHAQRHVPAAPVAQSTIEVRPRAMWQAKPPRPMKPMGSISRLTVHHSGVTARSPSLAATRTAIQAIQRHHQQQQGWADIGYHYVVDSLGRVWSGRDAAWQGAHAGGEANRGNLGICLLGNFAERSQRPSAAQIDALEHLIAGLLGKHGLTMDSVATHGELRHTDCPGASLQLEVDRIRGFGGRLAQSPRQD